MKKILISLSIVGAVAAIAIGATTAFFSDTETSTGNTFSAGTIDIAIDGTNPWTSHYSVGDLKPGETGNINFDITNEGTNPVNVSKTLTSIAGTGGVENYPCASSTPIGNGNTSSEPECAAEIVLGHREDNVASQIIYDLSVEVYASPASTTPIWWQAIYTDADGKSITDVYGGSGGVYVALGMIPVGGHMKVTQSYNFSSQADNKYQGDALSFDITIKGDQMAQAGGYASVVLENKTGPTAWDIIQDGISGTLSYKTQGPLFVYTFSGVAPLANQDYVLAVGYNANTDVDTEIGTGATNGAGNISFSGSVDTGSLTNAKAWLIPTENWTSGAMNWSGGAGWPGVVPNFLWETGLINYTKN